MKTTFFLAALFIAGFLLWNRPQSPQSNTHIAAYQVSKATRRAAQPVAPLRIVIDKSDYELHVYDAKGWFATYPVVFGANPQADKKMEGDRCTPEGDFKIAAKRPHSKWSRFLALDYPNRESLARFEERKRRGEVPRNATPGGGVGIHGTWPHEDFVIDRYKNWTNGCIALKREDVEELYNYIQIGTEVSIKR